jgi:methylamine dehydrogenase accessory protein MauD
MTTFVLVSSIALWIFVLFVCFLLLGTLRALGVLRWQLEQLQATTPSRIGRDGIRLGKKAPRFALANGDGQEVTLEQFAGRKVLLVFTQSGCSPCKAIVPELNKLHSRGLQVLVINTGEPAKTTDWAKAVGAQFPVLAQEKYRISKSYQIFATPFAFLVDEQGIISSKGLVGSRQHLSFVLSGAGKAVDNPVFESSRDLSDEEGADKSLSHSLPSKEMAHV